MYLVIRNISSGWKRPLTSWSAALRDKAIPFGDRLAAYIDLERLKPTKIFTPYLTTIRSKEIAVSSGSEQVKIQI